MENISWQNALAILVFSFVPAAWALGSWLALMEAEGKLPWQKK